MSPLFTPRNQRLLAIVLLTLVVLLGVAAISIPALVANRYYGNHLGDSQDKLVRYTRVAAMKPAIEQAVGKFEKLGPARFYLKGGSTSLAAADLQNLVTGIINSQNGKTVSSQVTPQKEDSKTPGIVKIAIKVQMNASITPLQLILHAFESAEPCLFIDQLTIRAPFGRGYKLVPGYQPEYSVQMTLHGYALAAGKAP